MEKKKRFMYLKKVQNKKTEKPSLKTDKVSLNRVWDISKEQIPAVCGIFHYATEHFIAAENFFPLSRLSKKSSLYIHLYTCLHIIETSEAMPQLKMVGWNVQLKQY